MQTLQPQKLVLLFFQIFNVNLFLQCCSTCEKCFFDAITSSILIAHSTPCSSAIYGILPCIQCLMAAIYATKIKDKFIYYY